MIRFLPILVFLLLVGCESPQPAASPRAAVVAPAPPLPTNYITLNWKANGTNGVIITNALTRVLWTDNLRTNWLPVATNSAGQAKFKTTNGVGFFKLQQPL